MKTIIIILVSMAGLWFCNTKAEQQAKQTGNSAQAGIDTIYFRTQIQPILQKNCSPCHFPGGKMYEKLPFDKGETIVNHESGVFKRIKDEKDLNLIRQFIQQSKGANWPVMVGRNG